MHPRSYIAALTAAVTLPFGLWASTALAVHGPTCTVEPTVAHPACPTTTTTVVSVPVTPTTVVSIPVPAEPDPLVHTMEPPTVDIGEPLVVETPQGSPLPVQGFASELPHTL